MSSPVVLITNARHFLGRGCARAIRARLPSATIVCHDLDFVDGPSWEQTGHAHSCIAKFIEETGLSCDNTDFVTSAWACGNAGIGAGLVDYVIEQHARIDALVSNDIHPAVRMVAGEDPKAGQHMAEALDALCTKPFELACAALSHMRARKSGKVVFVTSAAPLRGLANYVPYATARGAANSMMQSLALEAAKDNVLINAVGPNYIATETYFPRKLLEDPEARAKMTRRVPLGRLGTDAEAAAAVDFLLSPGGDFITGTVIPVAGGWGACG